MTDNEEEKYDSPVADDVENDNDADEGGAAPVEKVAPKSNGKTKSRSRSRSGSSSRSGSRKRSGSRRRHSSRRRHRRKRSRSKSRSRSRSRGRSNKHARRKRSPSGSSVSRSRSRSRDRHRRTRRRSRSRSRSPGFYRGGGGGPRSRYNGPRQECPPPTRCLGIFGMNVNTTEDTLADCFRPYGRIDKIQVIYDAKSGRSRGFAFIYFDTVQEAIDAKEQTSGVEIDGFRIRVDFSLTQRPHTPTPGIYMGKPMGRDEFYGGSRRGRSPSPAHRRRSRSRSYS